MAAYASQSGIAIRRITAGSIPDLPFRRIKEAVLGKDYDLSLVFPDRKLATQLHQDLKNKPGPANILSIPLDDNSGEIFISLEQARKEAKNYNRSYQNMIGFLFIHGLFHLKGYDHGSTMEAKEAAVRKQFNI